MPLAYLPVCVDLPWLDESLHRLVLWNPVLNLPHTFLEPELAWGLENFGQIQQKALQDNGFLVVDGEFELGRALCQLTARTLAHGLGLLGIAAPERM